MFNNGQSVLGSVSLKILQIGIFNFGNIFLDSLSIDLGNKKKSMFWTL